MLNNHDGVMPHAPDAERAVLGGIILDNAEIGSASMLQPAHFYGDANRRIFTAMLSMAERGATIDAITVGNELGADLERVGGMAYLSELVDGLPGHVAVSAYAGIVAEKAHRRELIRGANTVAKAAMNGAGGLEAAKDSFLITIGKELDEKEMDIWRTGADTIDGDEAEPQWVVAPYVVAGGITDLAGPPKYAGKTRWATTLCRHVLEGKTFIGGMVEQGPVVYLTEEAKSTFMQAMNRAGLVGHADFHYVTRKELAGTSWPRVVRLAMKRASDVGAKLIVVDTVASWVGFKKDDENDTGAVMEAMRPLQDAAAEGFAILATRHERKSGGAVGTAGRGSSAYTGAVDIVLSLRRPTTGTRPGVREIHAISRFDDTPDLLVVELDENEYITHGTATAVAFQEARTAVEYVAPVSESGAVTRTELLELVQAKDVDVSQATVNRAIDTLLRDGVLTQVGEGKRGSPFKFFLVKRSSLSDEKENRTLKAVS